MSQSELPQHIQLFLTEHIRSIEQLEILLLLQDGASRTWSPGEIYQVVRSSERSVQETLDTLHSQGLLQKAIDGTPLYRFSPPTEYLRSTIAELARLYAERRVRIIEAIYAERVSEMDEFAKAFRLRKDKNG